MNIDYKLYSSAFKHRKGMELPEEQNINLKVLKGEKFAFQIALTERDETTLISIGEYNHIGYKGLKKRIRVGVEGKKDLDLSAYFLGYVLDDESNNLIVDPILREEYRYSEKDEPTIIWIEGRVDKNFRDEKIEVVVNLFTQEGYENEVVGERIAVDIEVVDIILPELKDTNFHLDLWQHLSSWARMYRVPFWGEDHFTIIDNYIKELAGLGEKVITVVASDFSWEGQGCFQVEENSSNLFEHNIIGVKRNMEGRIQCDFTALERYLDICFKHGMEKEIDIFGLLASWQRTDFGSPLKDYDDYIRISFFSEKSGTHGYIDNKKDLGEYIRQVFKFFSEKNLMDRVRVISDMPKNPESFKKWSKFLKESAGQDLLIKTALHEDRFIGELEGISDISFSLPLLLKNKDKLEEIKEKLEGKLTWYVCWFPDKLNHFISSPLIESRLTGWYSYYMGLNGFLRWDYALWTSKPFENISYKYPRWKAGDMFFVYPGKDLKPIRSVRWENLRFGFQDQEIMKMAEKKVGREEINRLLMEVLGDKDRMKTVGEFSVNLDYSVDYEKYMFIKDKLIEVMKRS